MFAITLVHDVTEARERRGSCASGLLDSVSALDSLSISFDELLLLASDYCSASILLQLRNSGFIEELCQ